MAILQDNVSSIVAIMEQKAFRGVTAATLLVETDTKLGAPVKTGHHRRLIHHKIERIGNLIKGSVISGTDYGIYLEMGTRHMAARPHFRPALDRNQGNILRLIAAGGA